MGNSRPTQNDRILRYIQEHGGITQLEAMAELGVMRLASRISDLRHQGIAIRREIVSAKNRYGEAVSFAKYSLEEE